MEFLKNNKSFLFLLIFAFLCLCFSTGHYASLFIDVGREMFYPLKIIEGKVLYKDLFCIYGPFSYLFNAFIFKISGAKLSSLYLSGGLCALFIVSFIYLISKKFLNEYISFFITFYVISTGCLSIRIFNFTLPYSYAVLYGLLSFLISVYFLILYSQDKTDWKIFLSGAFLGLSISNKYDFILYAVPFLVVLIKTKNLKLILKSLLFAGLACIIPFLILFIQGLDIKDLINSLSLVNSFVNTDAFRDFYLTQGVYFNPKLVHNWTGNLIFCLVMSYLIKFGIDNLKFNIIRKIFGLILITAGFLGAFLFAREETYIFMTLLVCILFILFFRKNTFIENIFISSSILVGLKSLWGLSHVNYGLYYAGSLFISFFIMSSKHFKKSLTLAFCLFLFGISLNYLYNGKTAITSVSGEIKTQRGIIKTHDQTAKDVNSLLEAIKFFDGDSPSVMIFPEGLSINFLSDKKTTADGFYSSLIPLYTEGFGEDKIIEYYKKHPLDYVIFFDTDMSSYKKGAICDTYAQNFCTFVYENYFPYKIAGEANVFYIFKKRTKK